MGAAQEQKPSEKSVALALELGITNAERMTAGELCKAINAAPASKAQVQFVTALFAHLKYPEPGELTFAQAWRVLDEVAPMVDLNTLLDHKWQTGDVLIWRGEYHEIVEIHCNQTFTLARVEPLPAEPGQAPKLERTKASKKVHHPFTLHSDEAVKVEAAELVTT